MYTVVRKRTSGTHVCVHIQCTCTCQIVDIGWKQSYTLHVHVCDVWLNPKCVCACVSVHVCACVFVHVCVHV